MSSLEKTLFESKLIKAWERYQTGDELALEDIYGDLLPYCLRVASKTCNRYITIQDEESSIAQISILEAFQKYDPERGFLYTFLGRIIRNRIIDYKRVNHKWVNRVLPIINKSGNNSIELRDDSFFDNIIDDLARQQEIKEFKKVLSEFQISFEDLVTIGPKYSGTRETVKKVIWLITEDQDLSQHVLQKKQLPSKAIKERFNISHKTLEKYRKFIIAGVVILKYDFLYLKPYIYPKQGGIIND